MTEIPSYVIENPNFEPYKPKRPYNLYSSLLPILLSIFTYVLIFHVLDVSPSSIFNDTKILFLISNALILIVAADYGAFTDKENQDFYKEYTTAIRRDTRENPRLENSVYEANLAEEIKYREKQETVGAKAKPRYLLHKEVEISEKTVRVVGENQSRKTAIYKYKPKINQNIHITDVKEETCNTRKLVNPKPYGRSRSDKACSERRRHHDQIKHRPKRYDRSKSDSSKWMVVHKEKKKAHEEEEEEEKWENVREESEEFSNMSNEELNRRVEDFIQRFNRDIKRQKFCLV